MLEQELGGLESLRQVLADGLLDHPRAGETDHGARLGEDEIALHGVGGRYAAGGRIGQHGHERHTRTLQLGDHDRRLGHLHERQHPLLHAGAAGGGDEDQGRALVDRVPSEPGDLLPHHRAHRATHEGEIHHAEADRHAVQAGIARADRVQRPRLLYGGLYAVGVVLEFQGIGGLQRAKQLVPGTFIDQEVDVFLRRNPAMVAAIGTDIQSADEPLFNVYVAALITLFPGVCRDLELYTLGSARLTFFFEPGHSRHRSDEAHNL